MNLASSSQFYRVNGDSRLIETSAGPDQAQRIYDRLTGYRGKRRFIEVRLATPSEVLAFMAPLIASLEPEKPAPIAVPLSPSIPLEVIAGAIAQAKSAPGSLYAQDQFRAEGVVQARKAIANAVGLTLATESEQIAFYTACGLL